MSSGRNNNNDSCRDLSGRRLSSVKEAKRMAELAESAPERERARKDLEQKKLEKLNKEVQRLEAGPSAGAGIKRKADDSVDAKEDWVEKSREKVEGVKSAVAEGVFLYSYYFISAKCFPGLQLWRRSARRWRRKRRLLTLPTRAKPSRYLLQLWWNQPVLEYQYAYLHAFTSVSYSCTISIRKSGIAGHRHAADYNQRKQMILLHENMRSMIWG